MHLPAHPAASGAATCAGSSSAAPCATRRCWSPAATLGPIRSNIPLSPELALGPDLTADAHTMVDFGDDALTAGRAHPMIDPTLRLEQLARTAADPSTGVLLLDVVLGHGAEPDPAARLAPALAEVAQPVVVAVVGTAHDPQDLDRQVRALVDAGAEVHLSNAAATRRAVALTIGGARMTTTPSHVVGVGADLLADAVEGQAVPVTRVDWRPPMAGTEADLATVATDPRRREANDRALAAMLAVSATLVDVGPASEVLGLERGQFLHAGPPIGWDRTAGPLRGALMGGAALEGLVDDPGGRRRALRGRRRGQPRALPPPGDGGADGRRGHPVDVDVRARGPGHRAGARTARSTRASARCCGTAPTARTSSSGCAGCPRCWARCCGPPSAPATPST